MYEMKLCYFTNDESFPFFIQYGGHNEDMYIHGHEDFSELVVVLSGSAIHVVGEKRYKISKGDVFVAGKGIVHGYDKPENFRICNIMFRPEFFLSADYDIKQLPGFHALFLLEPRLLAQGGFMSRLVLDTESFHCAEDIIAAAVKEYESGSKGSKTMLTVYFLQLAVLFSRMYGHTEKRREIAGIAEAAAYMESRYGEDIKMETLFSVSHYSQRHFIRLFTEIYGSPPLKYLTGIRMRHACILLKDSDISVTEISLRCGYGDPNYFSRSFKKYSGMAPLDYRKQYS